jgi:hypothetical protein
MRYFLLVLLLFLSGKVLAENKIIPLGSINVRHQCYDSSMLETAMLKNNEELKYQMVGQTAKTLTEVWLSQEGSWTIIVKTVMANGVDVSCVVAAAVRGGILDTHDVIERGLAH